MPTAPRIALPIALPVAQEFAQGLVPGFGPGFMVGFVLRRLARRAGPCTALARAPAGAATRSARSGRCTGRRCPGPLAAMLAAAVALIAMGVAAAQPLPGAASAATPDLADRRFEMPAVDGTRDDFARALQAPVEGFLETARTLHQRLQPWGLNLLALLTGLSLCWLGLRTMLEPGAIGPLLTDLLTLLLTAGILFSVLDHWPAVSAGVIDGTREVARQVAGSAQDGTAAVHGLMRILDPAFTLWEHPQVGIAALFDWPSLLTTLLFKLVVAALLLICAGIYFGIYLVSMTLLSIAFALGPVLLPWLLLRPASFLFEGWLRFTLVAALYQIVGIVIVTLVSKVHEPMLASIGSAIGTGALLFNFYYVMASLLISGVSALMMLQIPAIANGLVSGSVVARGRYVPAGLYSAGRGAAAFARRVAGGSGGGAPTAPAAGSGPPPRPDPLSSRPPEGR